MPESLPQWDLTTVFPSLESSEFIQAFDQAVKEIRRLADLFDRYQVRRRASPAVDAHWAGIYNEVTAGLNHLMGQARTLDSYINCYVSTDALNEVAKARESLLDTHSVVLEQLRTRYVAWVGSSDLDALLELSAMARDHEYWLRRCQYLATHQMSEEEEALAAELAPASINGWNRLHGNLTALLTVPVQVHGKEKVLPMSAVRSLANDSDRQIRQAAFEAEVKAWEAAAVPIAAALNGVKGFQGIIRRRRGFSDDVEPTLIANSLDRPTLEAMQQACIESFPDFRRYMDAKAHALGLDHLAWYDLTAPLGKIETRWAWPETEAFIRDNFGRYSSRLSEFSSRAFQEKWVDAGPRIGKEGGAYCTHIRPGESRVMMNFDGSFAGVSTLAHELGHAYHNLNLVDRTPLQRRTPSTLAETASIFCETLAFDAALEGTRGDERLALIDTTLERDLMVVVDIHSRFLFERGVFQRRTERDLTVSEFNELMLECQRNTYGAALNPLHPYMWAVKTHYYGHSFYNYPYTFGLLFGLGLYACYQQDPGAFYKQYDEFLSSTGMADARTLARRFEVDITRVEFWRSSLDVIRKKITEFEQIVGR